MEHYDIASLTNDEQKRLRQLEESLGVVLVAYKPTGEGDRANHGEGHEQPGTCGGL